MYASFLKEAQRLAAEEEEEARATTASSASTSSASAREEAPRAKEVPPLNLTPPSSSSPPPSTQPLAPPLILEASRMEMDASSSSSSAKPLAMMPPTLAPLSGRGGHVLPPVASASHVQTVFGRTGVFTISNVPSETPVITQQPLRGGALDAEHINNNNNNNNGGIASAKGQRYIGSAKLTRLTSSGGSRKGFDVPTRVSSAGGEDDDEGKDPIRRPAGCCEKICDQCSIFCCLVCNCSSCHCDLCCLLCRICCAV